MDNTLNIESTNIAERLVNVGMANAASALSFMIGETVKFSPVSLQSFPESWEGDAAATVLLTPFIGDVLLEGYLILKTESSQRLADALLPSPGKDDSIRKAALLEIDNIMSASIATRVGDLLDAMIMGDVPRLLLKPQQEIMPSVQSRIADTGCTHYCYTTFYANRLNAEGIYICLFKPKFLQVLESKKAGLEKPLAEHEKGAQVYLK
jgi:chemotaxis protein CheY-P-specific phosphatase CheC